MKTNRRRTITVIAIVLACVLLDQSTKLLAERLLPRSTIHLLGDLVRLHLSENTGAFLGMGSALPEALRFWLFTVAGGLLLVPVAIAALTAPDLGTDGIVALAAVFGGGLGNVIDRAARGGQVVDFLNFGIGNFRTGILNVADIFITFGAIYVMWVAMRQPSSPAEAPTEVTGSQHELSATSDPPPPGPSSEQGPAEVET
jgi:signal peptidase II